MSCGHEELFQSKIIGLSIITPTFEFLPHQGRGVMEKGIFI
jgi:hypothetical protein